MSLGTKDLRIVFWIFFTLRLAHLVMWPWWFVFSPVIAGIFMFLFARYLFEWSRQTEKDRERKRWLAGL